MTKGAADLESLSDADHYRYARAVGTYLSLSYSAYIQRSRGLIDDGARHRTGPGFVATREVIKPGYPRSFRAAIAADFGARPVVGA